MKNLISILTTTVVILLANACTKQTETILEPDSEFSFTYNGNDYPYKSKYSGSVGVSRQGIRSIYIHRADVFGGDIYFNMNNCAYMAPELSNVYRDPACNLTSHINGQILPIDSSKVFTYQSGSLNLTISECKTYPNKYSISGPSSYSVCKASGTFNLTLVNKGGETIEITNGIINNFPAGY